MAKTDRHVEKTNAAAGEVTAPCEPAHCPECISPAAPPWLPYDQCLTWYESRVLTIPLKDRERVLQLLLVYEHCLQLIGRKQGPLLFTTTLLPKEKLHLYHYERYRRGRSETDIFSVHTSLRQYVSTLHQQWGQATSSFLSGSRVDFQKDTAASAGTGGLLGLFVSAGVSESTSLHTTSVNEVSLQTVGGHFDQLLRVASQAIDVERSVVVSTFEERDSIDVTQREIVNDNDCRAVTYFVRKVMEVYRLRPALKWIYWRVAFRNTAFVPSIGWRLIDDLEGADDAIRDAIARVVDQLGRIGHSYMSDREITIPTDGTLYEAELAHCSSCEPEKEAEHAIELQKAKAEVAALEAESQRRQALLAAGKLDPFEPAPSVVNP
jgi:thermitase